MSTVGYVTALVHKDYLDVPGAIENAGEAAGKSGGVLAEPVEYATQVDGSIVVGGQSIGLENGLVALTFKMVRSAAA